MVTVVLTPGHSGSSLLTEMLSRLGMGISAETIPGRAENARGFFEDARVVRVHKELLDSLGAENTRPLPVGWLDTNAARNARRQLAEIVREEAVGEAQWTFKDPRTTVLLPLWEQVFNQAGVVPRYVYAFRHPGAVAASLRRTYNRDEHLTELQWLYRTTEMMYHTAAAGFVVHYEDWFSRPCEVARGLVRWCGLEPLGEEALERMVAEVVRETMNRAGWQEPLIHHPLTKRLYGVLRDCNGDRIHRERLMAEVAESRRLIEGFRVWASIGSAGNGGRKNKGNHGDSPEGAGGNGGEHGEPWRETDLEIEAHRENVVVMHRQLREIKKLEEENHELRVRQHAGAGNQQRTAELGPQAPRKPGRRQQQGNRENHTAPTAEKVYNSVRYQLGDALMSAVISPGKNTVALPLRLYRLLRSGMGRVRARRRRQAARSDR